MTEDTRQARALVGAQGESFDFEHGYIPSDAMRAMYDAQVDTETYRKYEHETSTDGGCKAWAKAAHAALITTGIHDAAGSNATYDLSSFALASARDAAARNMATGDLT